MKQTAVEWLKLQLETYGDPQYCGLTWKELDELCEQAKAMEKEQIIEAYKQAHEDGYHFEGSVSDYEAEGLEEYLAEQYYNETFKSE